MDAKEISKAVIKRLPRYYRYLGELMEEKVERISSNDLSKKMHVTASQIRQDLNNFGGFGQQGYGYNVEYLYTEIGKILGLDTIHPMIILGAGNLGQALANYGDFEKRGFRLVGIFDINPVLEGISVRGIEIRMINSLPEFIRENQVEIAILTLPKNKAKEMAKVLIDNGIKAIWNFAHVDLDTPDGVIVENVHLSESLMTLSYNLSQYRQEQIQEKLSQLGIFSYMDIQYAPKDTTAVCDTLDITMQATFAKPLDAELELNVVTKSNDQTGPGASFGVTRNNVFGGGESWNVKLKGSYEWQTGGGEKSSLMNSWEMGISTSLTFPRVVFPRWGKKEFDFPATTTFRLYIDQLNRARYYKLLSFGGNATYDFQPTRTSRHSITPFKLTFNVLQHQSKEFMEIAADNPALYVSLDNQFIPAMEYTYTYDNASVRRVKNPIWWQSTVTSAGNVTATIYRAFGKPYNEEGKKLLGAPFSQFMKFNTEFRHLWNIDKNNEIASRVALGALFAYGNATIAPYSEQFYVGGANSIRAFTVRSIGPGGYHPKDSKYSYLDQTGTFRFEANVEYRFRIFKSIWGATFLDAGNVWLLRKDEARPDSQLRLKTFPKQIALGTGVGVRYDMDILVFRLDFGIPLHLPYDTERSGYYNVTGAFFKNLGIHFAIGYPF